MMLLFLLRSAVCEDHCCIPQVEEALEDSQRLSDELEKVQHRIRESERTVGASLETLQACS